MHGNKNCFAAYIFNVLQKMVEQCICLLQLMLADEKSCPYNRTVPYLFEHKSPDGT